MTVESHEEGGDADELTPEQEREHAEVVRAIAALGGFPFPVWTPKRTNQGVDNARGD